MSLSDRFSTHRVENQPPPLRDYNAYATDLPLREALARENGDWAHDALSAYGAITGGEMIALGFAANEQRPRLRTHDRYGHRIDEVEFHPAYHRVMELGIAHGVHAFAWRHADRAGAHVARAALAYLHGQAEAGSSCPLTMTHAAMPVIAQAPRLATQWLPRLHSLHYDPRVLPAVQKRGCTIGMGMTEKQGGSDVRANSTQALQQSDGSYAIVGHKWFFSAPMSDAWLVLAQTPAGLGCFLLPKVLADGARNAIHIQRLKDKLGDWSNASSEVEFHGACAERVGEEGRGIATILEMVALTRLDCMIGSSALMRQALVQAIHHARYRQAFGRPLVEHSLMQNVLADLALDSEAAIALSLRVARAVDAAPRDASEAALARVATAIGKYAICKRCAPFVNEAQECLGGAGYVEESMLPRLYRQAPLNSIWEGSGNIQCLDVLRAFSREPETREALFAELLSVRGAHAALDAELHWLNAALDEHGTLEVRARLLVERMALALQAALLLKSGNEAIANLWCVTRLGGERGQNYGTLPADAPRALLIERAFPAL